MDITLLDNQIENGEFRVEPGQSLHLNLASFSGFPNHEIYVKVLSNGVFKAAFADFSKGSGKLKVYIDLAGEGASAEWHCASICDGTSEKVLDVNLIHSAQHTKGLVSNYGISEDAARLSFLGTSEIKKGAAGSSTRQVAKIVVFDEALARRCRSSKSMRTTFRRATPRSLANSTSPICSILPRAEFLSLRREGF